MALTGVGKDVFAGTIVPALPLSREEALRARRSQRRAKTKLRKIASSQIIVELAFVADQGVNRSSLSVATT